MNDVGEIVQPIDGGTNIVRSYVIKSDQPNRTDIVVNYTVDGKHMLDEGFVMRYGEMGPNGGVRIVTYGEGDALLQVEALEGLVWGDGAQKIWNDNAQEIFDQARSSLPGDTGREWLALLSGQGGSGFLDRLRVDTVWNLKGTTRP